MDKKKTEEAEEVENENQDQSDADPILLAPDDPQVLAYLKDRKLKYMVIDENGEEVEKEI